MRIIGGLGGCHMGVVGGHLEASGLPQGCCWMTKG